jgi:Arginine decarboxylase (spermidine biosynthesis)
MRNNKEKSRFPASSQHGSQQDPNAGNQFEEQLDRFKEIFGIAAGRGSDTELGGKIRLTQQAIGKWREKGSIPSKWITKICDDQKINMNWLRDGEGPMRLDELCVREERGEYKVFTKPPRCGGLLPDHFVLVRCADAPLGVGAKSPIPTE